MNLRILRLAVDEIDHEVDYYESKHAGLGAELEDEIDTALELIVRLPQIGGPWKGRTDRRVFVLSRFPFTLPYQIVDNEIVVLALAHIGRAAVNTGLRPLPTPTGFEVESLSNEIEHLQ